MSEKIGNFSLVIPTENDSPDMPRDIKALVEDITAKLLGYSQDTEAKRPAAGVANRIFKATDTGLLWHDTGATWEPLITMSSASSYAASVARTKETEYEPSATRPTLVVINAELSIEGQFKLEMFCGGKFVGAIGVNSPAVGNVGSLTFICPPGAKYKSKGTVTNYQAVHMGL